MKTIKGNFLVQPSQSFPHDCELYDTMQQMPFMAHIIGNLAGDKAILHGCVKNGSKREPGYVFVCTKAHPEGEVLWFEGGTETSGMYIKYEAEKVSAQGIDFDEAYTRYWLAEGIGSESFVWDDFTELHTIPELKKEIDDKDLQIAALTPPPLGIVQIWAGGAIPTGYAICDGSQYRQEDYPELFKVLGTIYNTAPDYADNEQSTTPGYFRIPDLRGRFVVGQSSADSEYSSNAKIGGAKTVTLTKQQMPPHSHDYEIWERGSRDHNRYSNKSNTDNPDKSKYQTSITGGYPGAKDGDAPQAHENRPPFYTLAYIIRMK